MSSKPTLRYGHTEGQTEVCYDDTGKYLISCGRDGEVRIWKGIDDDEPTTITAGGEAYCVAVKGNIMYVAPDNNSVDRYSFPSGEQDGILARFTGTVTHLSVSESKKFVAAGSSDFDIKVMNIQTKKQKCFLGHQAPVLSVAIDPNDEYLASTSCDGKLKLWNMESETCIQSIDVVLPSNDVGNSSSLARLCWRPATGEDIAVSVDNGVKIYSRDTWSLFQTLTSTATDKTFQCCSFSPCGRFITGASVDGWIVVWDAETQDCLRTVRHPLQSSISSIMWNPMENNSLVFSDVRGQVGELESVVPNDGTNEPKTADELDALFEEEDDNMMVDLMAVEDKGAENDGDLPKMKRKSKTALFESDDEDAASPKRLSQDAGFSPIPSTLEVLARDDLDTDLAPPSIPPTAPPKLFEDDDASSVAAGVLPSHRIPPTIMQPPFQPGSTPVHLSHRFMVWNGIGVVRCYNDDTENAIDIEFHDAQTHHPLHVANQDGYTMADMNDKAVILAGESSDDRPSTLKCIHFSSWDSNKEWSVGMPDGEEIQSIVIGDCWIAASTDALMVRILSLGGIQRQIFSIPGQVVAMAAHTDQLMIVYHTTQGFGRSQCLGFMLLEVGAGSGCKSRNIIGGQHFPISRDSTLVWLGFTAEGTPGAVDSAGVIRLFNRDFCKTWSPVANLKEQTKSRHDHYWVVGLHENPQQIRCVLCKGASYPSTLPRPTVTVQPYSIPLCELPGDKARLECIHFSSWDSNKEWSVGMPDGEEIQSIVIGDCWIAASTDALMVRILSLGGIQRQIFSIPGQVVAMAAHTDQLMIVYHTTQGFGRSQCLGFMLLEVGAGSGCKSRNIIGGQHFPISRDSTLVWLGFTAEGTPGAVDSAGVIRLFNRDFCKTWSPVANLKEQTKSRHDHYWVVGLHENPQQIRCVLCKGASYPSTLPRPTVTVQPYSIPLCELPGDKARLEEEYWKTKLFSSFGDYLTSRGYEPDLECQRKSALEVQHTLMRLFALCCKSDHEFQAMEVSSLMPSSASVQLAVKYASRVRRIALAQRLQEVARDKLEEEQKGEEEVEEEEDFREEMQAGYSATDTEWSPRASQSSVTKPSQPRNDDHDATPSCGRTEKEKKTKPARSLSSQLAGSRRNPFKKAVDTSSKSSESIALSSGSVLDEMKRSTPTTMRRTPITSAEVTKKMKGATQKKIAQSTLKVTAAPKMNLTSTPKGKKTATSDPKDDVIEAGVLTEADTNVEKKRRCTMSGVLLFVEENLQSVRDEDPDVDGIEARKIIINKFRSLPPEKKKEWNEKARLRSGGAPSSAPKRKVEEPTNQNPPKSQKIEAASPPANESKSRLTAFAFSEDT